MTLEPATILIVDDEPFNVDYLEQELEDHGFRTVSAANGQEALDAVAAAPPDLILLDVMMPVMDGFTTCQRLKDNAETRLIPVVIMTALDDVNDRIKGIEAGADDFLTKPVNDRELLARIRTALKAKRAVEDKIGELSSIRDHFAKFVPDAVKRLVAENPDAPALDKVERDVTVLFVDISGYSRLSEQLAPDALNALVERYFTAFLDRLRDGGGDINETAGDGFMAIFQDPDPGAHATKAVDVALGFLADTERLNGEAGAYPLAIHIGVNSGSALVGSTRFEGAGGARWTFTASGPVTNIGARLAGIAESNEVMIGPDTARRIGDRFRVNSRGPTRLKNISEAMEVFEVVAM